MDARQITKISEALLWRIDEKKMTLTEAIDDLFGPGTFEKLASDLYDELVKRTYDLTVIRN